MLGLLTICAVIGGGSTLIIGYIYTDYLLTKNKQKMDKEKAQKARDLLKEIDKEKDNLTKLEGATEIKFRSPTFSSVFFHKTDTDPVQFNIMKSIAVGHAQGVVSQLTQKLKSL